jgi:hypothetical protein
MADDDAEQTDRPTPRSDNEMTTGLAYMTTGARRIPVVAQPRCSTCTSRHRRTIERLIVTENLAPRAVVARLPEGHGVSEQSVRRHLGRGHVALDHLTVQQHLEAAAERRWAEIGSPATDWLTREAEAAQATIEAGLATLTAKTVTITQVLRACRLLHEIGVQARAEEARQFAVDQVVDDLLRLFEIVGEVAGADLRDEIVRRCVDRDDPVVTVRISPRFADLRESASACQRRSA